MQIRISGSIGEPCVIGPHFRYFFSAIAIALATTDVLCAAVILILKVLF